MLEWMNQNSGALNVLVGVGTLLVWLLYFELLLSSFRRQKRSKILLLSDGSRNWKGRLLISNMSANPIYVEMVHIRLEFSDGKVTQGVLTPTATSEEGASYLTTLKQGPLHVSECSDLGTFGDLASRVMGEGGSLDAVKAMEITIGAIYASEDRMVGARRRYNCSAEKVAPAATVTTQLRSRRERRALEPLLEQAYKDA